MTKALIKNIDVITLDEAGAVLRNSHIAIDGKRILSVGDVPIDFTPGAFRMVGSEMRSVREYRG